jgi:hypothetical protein
MIELHVSSEDLSINHQVGREKNFAGKSLREQHHAIIIKIPWLAGLELR